jgi:hypothetical protein
MEMAFILEQKPEEIFYYNKEILWLLLGVFDPETGFKELLL